MLHHGTGYQGPSLHSIRIHQRKYPEGEGKVYLYAISLILSEIAQVRYSVSYTLQMRKSKFRETK